MVVEKKVCVVGGRVVPRQRPRAAKYPRGEKPTNNRKVGGKVEDMTIHIETLNNLIEAHKAEGLSNEAIVRVIEKMTKKSS